MIASIGKFKIVAYEDLYALKISRLSDRYNAFDLGLSTKEYKEIVRKYSIMEHKEGIEQISCFREIIDAVECIKELIDESRADI